MCKAHVARPQHCPRHLQHWCTAPTSQLAWLQRHKQIVYDQSKFWLRFNERSPDYRRVATTLESRHVQAYVSDWQQCYPPRPSSILILDRILAWWRWNWKRIMITILLFILCKLVCSITNIEYDCATMSFHTQNCYWHCLPVSPTGCGTRPPCLAAASRALAPSPHARARAPCDASWLSPAPSTSSPPFLSWQQWNRL